MEGHYFLEIQYIFLESDEETRPIHEDAIKDDTSEDIEVEDDEAVIEDILD